MNTYLVIIQGGLLRMTFFFFLEKSFKISFASRKGCSSIGSQETAEKNKLILWK